jgi:hypothetical protein
MVKFLCWIALAVSRATLPLASRFVIAIRLISDCRAVSLLADRICAAVIGISTINYAITVIVDTVTAQANLIRRCW